MMFQNSTYPWKLIILMAVNNLFLYFVLFSPPSYMPQLIHKYGVSWADVGKSYGLFGGLLFGAVGIGNLASSIIMTTWNNKYCLILMEALLGLCLIIFGFNESLVYVYINSVFIGVFLSVTAASKVIVYNMSTPETEQHIALWTFSGPCILGQVIGPSLAGIVSFPANNFPSQFNQTSFFGRYPTLLINLIYGVGLLVLSLTAFVILPTDNELKNYVRTYGDDLNEKTCLIPQKNHVGQQIGISSPTTENTSTKRTFIDLLRLIWKQILTDRSTILSIVLFAGYILLNDVYINLLPLWLQTPKSLYGREYGTDEVGYLLMASGLGFILMNYTVISHLNRKLSPKTSCAIWSLALIFLTVCISLLGYIEDEKCFFALCIIFNCCIMSAMSGCLTTCQVLLQRSVEPEAAAMVIGFSQIVNMMTSAVGNYLIGVTFSWSLTNVDTYSHRTGYPFGYHFSFVVSGFAYILVYMPLLGIGERMEKQSDDTTDFVHLQV